MVKTRSAAPAAAAGAPAPNRKRRRAPPAKKSPRIFNFPAVLHDSDVFNAENPPTSGCHEAVDEPNSGLKHADQNPAGQNGGAEPITCLVEAKSMSDTAQAVDRWLHTIDFASYAGPSAQDHPVPDHPNQKAAALDYSSPLTSLDSEGNKSGGADKEADLIFGENDNEQQDENMHDDLGWESNLAITYEPLQSLDEVFQYNAIGYDYQYASQDATANEYYDAELNMFVAYEPPTPLTLTDPPPATALDYNSADAKEMDKANENSKGDESVRNLPANPTNTQPTNTHGARKRNLSFKKPGRVRTVGEGHGATHEWYHPRDQEWIPAVYHQDIRLDLFHTAGQLGQYSHPMSGGKYGESDRTAFHPALKDCGPDRENWPKILFKYLPHQSDLTHVKPDYWYLHDGRVIVDLNDDAMFDYPEMPHTLAKNTDAWLLVTLMRLNNTITLQDLRGRMVGDRGPNRADPLGRNRISMSMQRFRKFACCLTWNTIREVDVQRDYLEKKLPRRCFRENSTKSFRLLHNWEVAELDSIDAGKFLSRTQNRAHNRSTIQAEEVYRKKVEEATALRVAFEMKHPDGIPNEYDTEDDVYAAQHAAPKRGPAPVAMMTAKAPEAIMVPGYYPAGTNPKAPDIIAAQNDESIESDLAKAIGMTLEGDDPAVGSSSGNGGGVQSDTKPAPVKRKGRRSKQEKVEQAEYNSKRLWVLPNEGDPVDAEAEKRRSKCHGGHRNYAKLLTTAPSSVQEAQMVYDLLEPTRRHFKFCTGCDAAPTEGDDCYQCQYRQIQSELNDWHRADRSIDPMQVCMLVRVLYVDDSALYWNVPWNRHIFGRAPCREQLGLKQIAGERVLWS
ncbi:MAG: hypothetical protein Q9208_002783 [Pyrenodesmia sp. 3 TL-2023]